MKTPTLWRRTSINQSSVIDDTIDIAAVVAGVVTVVLVVVVAVVIIIVVVVGIGVDKDLHFVIIRVGSFLLVYLFAKRSL